MQSLQKLILWHAIQDGLAVAAEEPSKKEPTTFPAVVSDCKRQIPLSNPIQNQGPLWKQRAISILKN